ncbi:MAG: PRC-barrel domain containing protein [Pseudomonadota bacterium]
MDHTTHMPLDTTEMTDANLKDAVIYGVDDYEIGTVAHVDGTGPTAQVIVDVGGFLGIGSKMVALNTSQLQFMRDEDGVVHATTAWTKDQVEQLPEHQH